MDLNSNSTSKPILEERLVVLEIAFDRLEQKFHQREKWCEILNLWILQQFDFNIETYWLDLIGETGVGDGGDPESDDVTNVGVGAGAHGQMFEMQNLGFYTEMPISMEYDDSREAQVQDPLEHLQQDEGEETRNGVEFGVNKKYIVPCYTFVDEDERDVEDGGEILESNNGEDLEGVESSLEMETEMEADSTNNIDHFEIRQENEPGERTACARSAASCATGDVTLEHLLSTPPKQGPSTTDIDAIINRLDAASSDLNREQLNEANLNSAQGPFTIIPFSQSQSLGMTTKTKSQSQTKNQQQIIQLGNQNSADPQQSSMMSGGGADNNFMQFPITFVPLGIALTSSPAVSATQKSIQSARPSPQVQVELHQQQKEQSQPKQSGQGVGQISVGSTSPPNSSSISKERLFPCSRCQKKFCSLDAVEAHMKTHRENKQREKIGRCEHCGKVYRTWKFFQKHCVTCVMNTTSKKSSASDPNNDHWGIISKDLSDSIANNSSNNSDSIHSVDTAASDSSTKKSKPNQSTSSSSTTATTGQGPGTSSGTVKKKPAKPRPSRSKAAKRERALLISNMCTNISKSNMTTTSPVSMPAATGTVSSVMGTEAATTSSPLGRGSVTGGSKAKKLNGKEINSVQGIAPLPRLYEPNADDLVHPSFFANVLASGIEVQSKPTKSPPQFKSFSSSANKGNLPTPVPTTMKVPAGKTSGTGVSLDPYDLIPSPTTRPNSNSNSNSSSQSKHHHRNPSQKRPEKNNEESVLVFNCKVCRLPFNTLQLCRQHIITTHLAHVLQTTPVIRESTATAGAKSPNSVSGAASPSTSRTSSTTTTTTTTTTTPSVVSASAQLPPFSAPVLVPATVPSKALTPTATTMPNLDFHINDFQQNLSPLHSQFNLNNTASAFPLSFPSNMLSPTMTTSIGGFPNLTNFANLANLASLTNLANLANFSHLAAANHQNLLHLGNSSNPLNLNFNYANMAANLANPLNLNFANNALNLNHLNGPSSMPIYSPSNMQLGLNDIEEVSSGIEQNQITFHSASNPGSNTNQGSAKPVTKKGASAGGSRATGRPLNAKSSQQSRLKSLLTHAHAQEDSQGFGFDDIGVITSTASATPTPLPIPTPTPAVIAVATTRAAATAMATTATTATTAGNNAITRPSSSCSSSSLIIDENETLNNVPSPENMYPYICLHCKRLGVTQGFESGQEIHEHILRHHVTTIRFHCPFSFCQQVFLEQDAFEEHIVSDHRMPV